MAVIAAQIGGFLKQCLRPAEILAILEVLTDGYPILCDLFRQNRISHSGECRI